MASRLLVSSFAAVAVSLALTSPGCSNQGEGERCSTLDDNNGDDDCQDGYQCYLASQLNGSPQTDICCPGDRAYATTAVCALSTAPVGDGGLPPEGGSTTTADSGADSSSTTGDSSSDAPATEDTGTPTTDAGTDANGTIADASEAG